MLSEVAIFVCLLTMLIVFLMRKKQLSHVKYGSELISVGFAILAFASLIDMLFIGNISFFDVGLGGSHIMQIWTLLAYIPGMMAVIVGIFRILPAIGQMKEEISARRGSEDKHRKNNARLKRAIERAELAERTLIDAIESMSDAVAVFDKNDRLVTFNNAYRELYTSNQDKLKPGQPFEVLLRSKVSTGSILDAIGREEEWIAESLEARRRTEGPAEYKLASGKIYRLVDNRTKAGGIVSIRTDVTEMREREKALEDSRSKLEQAQTIAQIGNWIHNNVEDTHDWSNEIFRILGFEPGTVEPSYKQFIALVHHNDVENLKTVFNLSGAKREPFDVEFRIIQKTGKLIYVRVLGRLDFDTNGRLLGASGTLQDITAQHLVAQELRLAKKKAEQGTRSKSLFLANMSHELRTPLNAVIGFSEVLAKEIFGPIENAKYREYADNIQSSGRHLLSLIDDILDYSRLESGTVKLQETEFNLYELVQSTQIMLAAKAIEKSTLLSISNDLDIRITGDERKLKQVLINVVNNAIKFTPEQGLISLHASTDSDQYISIFVEDNGYGIDEDEIENVMRPFGRAHRSVTKSIEGTGLGLPLTKSIVELHGGELKIASNSFKPGTTVEIRLPKSRVLKCA
ncbi:ATP-binding protein [Sneathiella sp.]|uniref:ATP-binding protein n=1 Tax=Sneathiella sp. TaxID=1964365 RepID=UPI00356529C7